MGLLVKARTEQHVVLDATTRRNDSCPSTLRRCVQDDGSAVTRMAAAWRELAGVPVAVATRAKRRASRHSACHATGPRVSMERCQNCVVGKQFL